MSPSCPTFPSSIGNTRTCSHSEWTTPLLEDNYAHRHCSHLYAIYYGLPDEIANDPKLREAFRVALEKRMDIRRKEAENISISGNLPGEMAFGIVFEAMAAATLRHADECALILEWLANRYWNSYQDGPVTSVITLRAGTVKPARASTASPAARSSAAEAEVSRPR